MANYTKLEQTSLTAIRLLRIAFLTGYCLLIVTPLSLAQAQRPDVSAIEKTFYHSPTPKGAAALSTAYQGLARWFQKAPQFNRDSTIFVTTQVVLRLGKLLKKNITC